MFNPMEYEMLDEEKLMESFAGDEEILFEVVDAFIAEIPNHLKSLKEAIAAKDLKSAEITSHTLKGLCATFCSNDAKECASHIEQLAGTENPDFTGFYEDMESQLNTLKIELSAMVDRKQAA